MEKDTPVVGHAILGLLLLAGVVGIARFRHSDIAVGRRVFTDLVSGRQTVARRIDWEQLTAMGVNVGGTYTKLPNDQAKANYRKAFIEQTALAFRKAGGAPVAFQRWRLKQRDAQQIVVAAEYPAKHKTLLVTLSSERPKRLTSLQWQNADIR